MRVPFGLLLCMVTATGCAAGTGGGGGADASETAQPACLGTVWVPGNFDFRTAREVAVDVTIVQPDGTPWPGVIVQAFDAASDAPGLQVRLGVGVTDADGRWQAVVTLPADQPALNVVASLMGARNHALVTVADGRAAVELGRDEQ